jgi:energy-coupling factor transporter transmembrane protein EcfT
MLPERKLIIFIGFYLLFILWARLVVPTLKQLWRMKWILLILFLLDWWLIGFEHGLTICTRLALLTGVFTLFFTTTTTRELGLALEYLRIPYRYAFSLSLAFQSLGIMDDEWRAIREAQISRGALREYSSFRRFLAQVSDLVALTVPAIVLTTKRAWSITEAAHARGFDSPKRQPYHTLAFSVLDGVLAAGTVAIIIFLYWS